MVYGGSGYRSFHLEQRVLELGFSNGKNHPFRYVPAWEEMKLKEDVPRLRRQYLDLVAKAEQENGKPSRLTDTKPNHENHHIFTVNRGGSNHLLNLVRMTYRQHYIAHLILSNLQGDKFNMNSPTSRRYAAMKERVHTKLRALATTPEALQRAIERARNQDNSRRAKPTYASNKLRSEALKGREYTCPHCGKEGGGGMLRWHFDRCKFKK